MYAIHFLFSVYLRLGESWNIWWSPWLLNYHQWLYGVCFSINSFIWVPWILRNDRVHETIRHNKLTILFLCCYIPHPVDGYLKSTAINQCTASRRTSTKVPIHKIYYTHPKVLGFSGQLKTSLQFLIMAWQHWLGRKPKSIFIINPNSSLTFIVLFTDNIRCQFTQIALHNFPLHGHTITHIFCTILHNTV